MSVAESPQVIVLAGPNGAGKTTLARALLPDDIHVRTFVNADVIAQGLAGFEPEIAALEAGYVMLERLRKLAQRRADFAFETTLASRTHATWLRQLQRDGYICRLLMVTLKNPDLCVARVQQRVAGGGHNIPEGVIRRRYVRGLANFFNIYSQLADSWTLYDNSSRGAAQTHRDRRAWKVDCRRSIDLGRLSESKPWSTMIAIRRTFLSSMRP